MPLPRLRLLLALAWSALATLSDLPEWCLHHLGPLIFLIAPATIVAVFVIVIGAALTGRLHTVRTWRGPAPRRMGDGDMNGPLFTPGPGP